MLTPSIAILGNACTGGGARTGKGEGLSRPLLTVDLTFCRPLIGKTVNLMASLGFIADIRLEPDANTGIPKVVVKNCSSNEDSISLNLLGR